MISNKIKKINSEKLPNGFILTVDNVFHRVISYNPKSENRAVFEFGRPILEPEVDEIRETVKKIDNEGVY